MRKNLLTIIATLLCCITASALPTRQGYARRPHHTHRLPGVNERRLARLEKMREANIALRHRQGPWKAKTQAETKRGLVLLVQFSDTGSRLKSGAAEQWDNRFNQQGYSLNSHIGSVRDYFIEQSYGLLTIDFDVVGPLTLSKTRQYYGSAPNDELDDRAPEMVIEALKLANPEVNYADYDWDGDGYVDQVYVIYAGITKYATEGYIWPHEWSLSSGQYYGCGGGTQRLDNVYIDTYAVSNELANSTTLEGIGTACHEFSHCLGYPDFYDTSYMGGTAAQNWDVLDGGCYNGPRHIGEVPSPYTAYERWIAGWIDLIPLSEPCKVTDMPAINEEGVAYVINNSGNTNEYYILENRQQKTFGAYNHGHGLMVWHVDYNSSAWANNTVNSDADRQRMTFVPADGQVGELMGSDYEGYYYEVTTDDEAGDPFPGITKVDSVPTLTWYVAERRGTKKHPNLIHDIRESGGGKISFIYGDYRVLSTPEIAEPTNILADSFTANWLPVDGATSYNLEVEVMTGEESAATVFAEDFSGFAATGADAQVSNSVIDKYTQAEGWTVSGIYGTKDASARLGSASIIGSMLTPVIDNRAGDLIVEFDAAYYNTDGSSIVVSVLKNSDVIATDTVELSADRTTYSLTFEDIPSGCQVQFETTKRRKRLYLYDVNIMDMSGAGYQTTLYEGLTSTSFVVSEVDGDMYFYRVQAVCEDGTSDWTEWMDVDIASGISETAVQTASEGEMYDLAGRRIFQAPKRGLYIRNGKTYMAR